MPVGTLPSALLVDLDGTLLDKNNGYTESAAQALMAVSKIIPVAIATGRYSEEAAHFARALRLTGPQIAENGARIVDVASGKVWHEQLIPATSFAQLSGYLRRKGIHYCASDAGRVVSSKHYQVKATTIVSVMTGSLANALELQTGGADKMGIKAEVSQASTGQWYVMFTHRVTSKGHAARIFAKQIGIKLSTVMAVGDGPNDTSMFDVVGFSVAMGHACPSVKRRARFITATLKKDGLAKAIHSLILAQAYP